MASATRKTVEKTIAEDVIVLELTAEEAEWLKDYVGACTNVEKAAPIYRALNAPAETDDRPIKVGDKVRIVRAAYDRYYNGYVGVVSDIDENDMTGHYRVNLTNGDYEWATTVERVND
jgi:ATP-dependent exoDNAse (exonuclease V) alpha subunit